MGNEPTMMTYILESPDQLKNNILNAKEITKELVDLYCEKDYRSIWIIACGSSSNGSNCAKPFMMKYLNCDVKIVNPSTFLYSENKIKEDDFVFVVSQSGCSTNSIDALRKLKEMNIRSIGLTGNANSDFKKEADVTIDWCVGEEKVGYVTKGVTTLCLFFILFSLEAGLRKGILSKDAYDAVFEELKKAPERNHIVQNETMAFYQTNKKTLTAMNVVYSVGFAQGYGISCESALKMGETIKVPSFAYEAEEYIHGPNLQLTPDYTVFIYDDMEAGSKRIGQIYQATQSVTDKTFMVTNNPIVPEDHAIRLPFDIKEPALLPLYVLPFVQTISYLASDDLNSWDNHPLFAQFKHFASTKTDTIKDIMPDCYTEKE